MLIVRPPHAWHTLLVNLGPQSASLVSCFLLLDRQARPVPVCAASRSWISWQLPLWGQDPKGRGSAAQSVTTAAYVPFAFIRGGLLGLGYLSAASCLGEQSSARFSSCGFYPTSQRKPTWCSWSPGMPCALRFPWSSRPARYPSGRCSVVRRHLSASSTTAVERFLAAAVE